MDETEKLTYKIMKDAKIPGWIKVFTVVFLLGILVALFLLFSWLFMLVWNEVIPTIFALPLVNYKQALGLMLLPQLLLTFPLVNLGK